MMAATQKLEDITSKEWKEYLDEALENAKSWCLDNLPKYLHGFRNEVDYSIFRYVIDNEMIGPDMRLDEKQSGLIRVSTRKLKWYQEREEYFRKNKLYSKIRESLEVDLESMFVHEITEFIILSRPDLFKDLETYLSKYLFRAHKIARKIENINRNDRGLKDWIESYYQA